MVMIALRSIWRFLAKAGEARYEKYKRNPQAYWY
jgi:hypothetical protein